MTTMTKIPTACPPWCRGVHLTPESGTGWVDDYHTGGLSRLDQDSFVDLSVPLDPERAQAPTVDVWIRGNGLNLCGSRDVPFTVHELLGLSAMFAEAAAWLASIEAAS